MKLQLVFATILVLAGCTEPERTGPPVGYVDENVHKDLQARFDKLYQQYNAKSEAKPSATAIEAAPVAKVTEVESEAPPANADAIANAPKRPPVTVREGALWKTFSEAPNWSSIGNSACVHTSGARVEFDREIGGMPVVRLTYNPASEAEAKEVTSALQVLPSIGGTWDGVVARNTKRIQEWQKSPSDLLVLEGAIIYMTVLDDGDAQMSIHLIQEP